MPMQLPTDTTHLNFETRQYELFNRPLGQGISRRKMAVGIVACAVWWAAMLLCRISLLTRFGPAAYIVPPFVVIFFGTRIGDDGRMHGLLWYDALLARFPHRRRLIRNPLLSINGYEPAVLPIAVTTELHPRTATADLTPLLGRRGLLNRRRRRTTRRPR